MLAPDQQSKNEPIAVLGSGDLVSHLYRQIDGTDHAAYRFNIFRLNPDMAVTQELRACDLRDLVKLCQVLTFAIVDDGWCSAASQEVLLDLNEQLDQLTQSWRAFDDE